MESKKTSIAGSVSKEFLSLDAAAIPDETKYYKRGTHKKPKTFVTLFPETENVHLTKDVGMIPYIMHKYFNYDSRIVCYRNGEYPYITNEVNGLKIEFLERTTGDSEEDAKAYLLKNAAGIDLLHLFHICRRSLVLLSVYKQLNPSGKVYLKLDANKYLKNMELPDSIFSILKQCDLISIETKSLYNYVKGQWPVKVEYLPNGFYNFSQKQETAFEEKENIICTVGRIGLPVKAHQVLLEAFCIASSQIKGWKLKIIGPVMDSFKQYISDYFDRYPHLKDIVLFTGEISDKTVLEEEYRKAKLFCMTSIYESFGLVFVEAAKSGCFILSSDIDPAWDITDNQKYGEILEVGNTAQLADALIRHCKDETRIRNNCKPIQAFAYKNFYWVDICAKINNFLVSEKEYTFMENHLSSIVILTHNNLVLTQNCINSIRRFTAQGTYEIIVVDNNSADGTVEWLKSQNDIKTIFNTENAGFPKGCNQGIEIARGDSVLLLNNDTIVTPNWLQNLTTCLYSNDNIGAVGPLTNNCALQQIPVTYKTFDELVEFAEGFNHSDPQNWEERIKLIGFCLLIKKPVMEKVGLLDERFSPGNFEDDDYSFRIRLAGYRLILCKDTFIHHMGSMTFITAKIPTGEVFQLNQRKFEEKWGFNPSYSTQVRQELTGLITHQKTQRFTLLDIGCSCGATLLQIKNAYPDTELFGIELNKSAAEIANTVCSVTSGNIENLELDYEEGYFDYIMLADVLEHLTDPWKVLENIRKYLKPGGKILASIPNIMHFTTIRGLLYGNWTYEDSGILDRTHMRFFTLNEIRKMFINAGYHDIHFMGKLATKTSKDQEFIQALCSLTSPDLAQQYEVYQYLVTCTVKPGT